MLSGKREHNPNPSLFFFSIFLYSFGLDTLRKTIISKIIKPNLLDRESFSFY